MRFEIFARCLSAMSCPGHHVRQTPDPGTCNFVSAAVPLDDGVHGPVLAGGPLLSLLDRYGSNFGLF